ncbi:MAG: tetratricopeptide repeat protein [Egibacteraceae bacterium]
MIEELNAYVEQLQAEQEERRKHSEAKPELVRRFEEAEHTLPAGYAVVLAASDCARAGAKHPLSASDLIGLARDYYARLRPGEPIGDDGLRAGVDWAALCEQGQLPLLIPAGDDAYRVSPAIDRMGFEVPPVPSETWDWLFAHLPPMRLLELGDATKMSLYKRDRQMTERAWTHAFEAGQEPVRSAASVSLGMLYADRGDDEDAIVALERADTSLLAPSAQAATAFTLGLLYDRGKNADRARSYYEQAIEADDWRASPHAAYNLGLLLGDLGDADGAEAAFTHAIEGKYYPDQDQAIYALAITLEKLGELDRAEAYYERAIATDVVASDVPSKAALDLGLLHEQQGRTDQAIAAYERGVTGCNDKLIAEAIWRYARLAAPKEQVDPIVVYQRLLGRLRDYVEPAATCRLGQWLWCHGEHAAAAALFERAMASAGNINAEAAFLRGWLAHAHEDDDVTARACYRQAIDSRDREHAAQAANNLGVLLAGRGEHDEAVAMFRSVRSYPRCTATAKAALNAGLLLERAGRTGQARTAFEQAIDADNPVVLPRAVAHLARLLLRTKNQDAASALLDQWRNADDPELAKDVADAFEQLRSRPDHALRLLTEPW